MLSLPQIHAAIKNPSGQFGWVEGENDRVEMEIPLEISGITLEGLYVRLVAKKSLPDESVMINLECPQPLRRDYAIERVDWRPLHSHQNDHRAPWRMRFMKIDTCHWHRFDLNWRDPPGRLLSQNLPVACKLEPEIPSFRGLLEFCAEKLKIPALAAIKDPPWQKPLL